MEVDYKIATLFYPMSQCMGTGVFFYFLTSRLGLNLFLCVTWGFYHPIHSVN